MKLFDEAREITTWTVIDSSGLPVEEIDDYLAYLTALERSPNTVRAYAHDLSLYCRYLERAGTDLYGVGPQTLGYFIQFLRRPADNVVVIATSQSVRSASTVNRALAAVAGLYDFLEKRDGLAVASRLRVAAKYRSRPLTSVIDGVGNARRERAEPTTIGPRLRAPSKRLRYFTIPQARKVIEGTQNLRDRLLLTVLLLTGMRIGQALALRHSDLDVRKQSIQIVPRPENADWAQSKNRASNEIPISRELTRLYLDYMSDEYGMLDSDFIFVNLWSGKIGSPLSYSSVTRLVERLRENVDLEGAEWSLHTFRHTFAMVTLQADVPVEVISSLLTHKSIRTTTETYAKYQIDHLRNQLVEAGIWGDEDE